MRGVLHGDRVRVRVTGGDDKRREGALVEVIERSAQDVVGRLVVDGDQTLVVPENPRLPRVLLAPNGRGKARAHGTTPRGRAKTIAIRIRAPLVAR